MKRWEIINSVKGKRESVKIDDVVTLLLENRGIKTKEERDYFLHPKLEDVTPGNVGIDLKQLKKALRRIQKAIDAKEQIIVFGDYDVDGITGAAILWETLHSFGANALPYIPHRVDEGYGLSVAGIKNLLEKYPENCHPKLVSGSNEMLKVVQHDKGCLSIKLIITVDNGIVAHEAVEFANRHGIDVIITDHHTVGEKLPDVHAVVHTTKLCGAGVAYLLAQELRVENSELRNDDNHLELAALGTVADLVPLNGANRTIVKYGLEKLGKTKRPGLLHLFKQAKLDKEVFTTYDVGFIIAPRLNAAGRIESAMDSLRILCTNNFDRAEMLAEKLELTNRERQLLMKAAADHAKSAITNQQSIRQAQDGSSVIKKLLFIADEGYPQGVIGLVAGKLVEEFYRPSIVVSIGETHSKASVRSINGFNVVEFLRGSFDEFVNIGGHPMAAGFTVETTKLKILQEKLEQLAESAVDEGMLVRSLKVDCELPFSAVNFDLYNNIQQLAPFGMANQEPTFMSRDVVVDNIRILGKDSTHLKLVVRDGDKTFDAIAFKMAEKASDLNVGNTIDLAYTIDTNTWNGKTTLQLKVKDFHLDKSLS